MKSAQQIPASVDRDLCAVARMLRGLDWRVHLAEVALELGAISRADYALICAVAQAGELDDLESEAGQAAWRVLAKWTGDDETPN